MRKKTLEGIKKLLEKDDLKCTCAPGFGGEAGWHCAYCRIAKVLQDIRLKGWESLFAGEK